MLYFKGSARSLIDDADGADLAFRARLLDEHPGQIRRAVRSAGRDGELVRSFFATRQLGLDFDGTMAKSAERRATESS